MRQALTKRSVITVEMLRGDRTLCPRITGKIYSGLRGNVTDLSGDVSGLSGDVSGLRGCVSGLRGNVTGLRGNVDDCELSKAERDAGIDVNTLILPA